jgi:hypothetical protein
MSTTNNLPPQLADLLAPLIEAVAERVAERLGKQAPDDWVDAHTSGIGVRTFRKAAKAGAFQVSHIGRKWVARRSDVDRWVASQRVDPTRRPARDEADPLEKALAAGRLRAVAGHRGRG